MQACFKVVVVQNDKFWALCNDYNKSLHFVHKCWFKKNYVIIYTCISSCVVFMWMACLSVFMPPTVVLNVFLCISLLWFLSICLILVWQINIMLCSVDLLSSMLFGPTALSSLGVWDRGLMTTGLRPVSVLVLVLQLWSWSLSWSYTFGFVSNCYSVVHDKTPCDMIGLGLMLKCNKHTCSFVQ